MKFSATFVVALVSSVVTPANASHALPQTQGSMDDTEGHPLAPASCPALLQDYYNTDFSDLELQGVVSRCLDTTQTTNQLSVPMPGLLKVELPHLPARTNGQNTTQGSDLPSLQKIEEATTNMEANINTLLGDLDSVQYLDHADQVDLVVCGLQLHGAKCEDGHFLPKTGLLRQVAGLALRLTGKHLEIEKAIGAIRQTKLHQIQTTKSMAKMMQGLATTYPSSDHNNTKAAWIKTYRLVRTNIELVSDTLITQMTKKLEPAHERAFFRSSV